MIGLAPQLPQEWVKTDRQREAVTVLKAHRHGLLWGGSRSGKTTIIVRSIIIRALKRASKHLAIRFRFNHARVHLGHETIPKVLRECFPGLPFQHDKTDWFWTFPSADGGQSELWLGGTDDKDRMEKLLGSEYSTIYSNESSQIPFAAIVILMTRLAENSGLDQRFWYDCNPSGVKHWSNQVFNQGKLPDGSLHMFDTGSLQMNPAHNLENLSPEYVQSLEALPKRQRQRFLDGLYLTDVEGALWTDQMISDALTKVPGQLKRIVIAIDPSTTNNPGSDECGIIPCAVDENNEGVVLDDLSGKMSPKTWAQRAVNAYHRYDANAIVAEVNQGGDLVEDAIHAVEPRLKVIKVRAAVGKFARAEPISQRYELGEIAHAKVLPELEAELTETVFADRPASPNRLDAMVWGFTHLLVKKLSNRVYIG